MIFMVNNMKFSSIIMSYLLNELKFLFLPHRPFFPSIYIKKTLGKRQPRERNFEISPQTTKANGVRSCFHLYHTKHPLWKRGPMIKFFHQNGGLKTKISKFRNDPLRRTRKNSNVHYYIVLFIEKENFHQLLRFNC